MADGTQPDIEAPLVSRLVATQFPQWAHLPIKPVAVGGWNNKTFHLGERMLVRLPKAGRYAVQVEKEQLWLPRLAPCLPLPIPTPLALGTPDEGYPWPWSVYGWIEGETAASARIVDEPGFATALAGFLAALQRIDSADGPPPGKHNFFRGGPLTTYDAQTRQAIAALGDRIDADAVTRVWDAAVGAAWNGPAVWLHGDFAAGNLLMTGGRLSAVIDFGTIAVGDPACDLSIAWTLLGRAGRDAFRAALPLDRGTWARGRGWTLWKALILLSGVADGHPRDVESAGRVLAEVLAD
jgi:aminoglycoside phosphotransferase (APT) family kinase protein